MLKARGKVTQYSIINYMVSHILGDLKNTKAKKQQ